MGKVHVIYLEGDRVRVMRCGIPDRNFLNNHMGKGSRAQPIDVKIMGALLSAFDDPDAEIMQTYDTGVPLGMGVDLPRSPMVFPEKVKCSLKDQEEWGGDSDQAEAFVGMARWF